MEGKKTWNDKWNVIESAEKSQNFVSFKKNEIQNQNCFALREALLRKPLPKTVYNVAWLEVQIITNLKSWREWGTSGLHKFAMVILSLLVKVNN